MKVSSLIKSALRKVGAVSSGQTPPAAEMQDALDELNLMLDQWSTKSLMVYAVTTESLTLTAGQSEYTWGTGGDFTTARPVLIQSGYVREGGASGGTNDIPIEIKGGKDTYNLIAEKSTEGRSYSLWYEPEFPLGKVRLYPTADGNADQLFLDTWKALSAFTGLTQTVAVPPGYESALVWQLARRIAPEYGYTLTTDERRMAKEALNDVMRLNAATHIPEAQLDPALAGRHPYNSRRNINSA
jgi:hypothetical protein